MSQWEELTYWDPQWLIHNTATPFVQWYTSNYCCWWISSACCRGIPWCTPRSRRCRSLPSGRPWHSSYRTCMALWNLYWATCISSPPRPPPLHRKYIWLSLNLTPQKLLSSSMTYEKPGGEVPRGMQRWLPSWSPWGSGWSCTKELWWLHAFIDHGGVSEQGSACGSLSILLHVRTCMLATVHH